MTCWIWDYPNVHHTYSVHSMRQQLSQASMAFYALWRNANVKKGFLQIPLGIIFVWRKKRPDDMLRVLFFCCYYVPFKYVFSPKKQLREHFDCELSPGRSKKLFYLNARRKFLSLICLNKKKANKKLKKYLPIYLT